MEKKMIAVVGILVLVCTFVYGYNWWKGTPSIVLGDAKLMQDSCAFPIRHYAVDGDMYRGNEWSHYVISTTTPCDVVERQVAERDFFAEAEKANEYRATYLKWCQSQADLSWEDFQQCEKWKKEPTVEVPEEYQTI